MSRITYNLKQALTQIWRNKGMSVASIFAIMAMMLILGLFFVITVNVNLFTEVVKQDYDLIEVYLEDETTPQETTVLMNDFNVQKGVKSVEFRSKEEALNILKGRWGESGYLLDALGKNPLPNSILVGVDSVDNAKAVNSYALNLGGIEDVKFYQETVEKLTRATDFLQMAAAIVMLFLIVVSLIVVSNTIKLTVFNRAKEISIMKYIGATNWFIRGPFLAEGILIGIFSSIVSVGATTLIYGKITSVIGSEVMSIISAPLVPVQYMATNLIVIFLTMGISIGAWGSIISMRKFLDT